MNDLDEKERVRQLLHSAFFSGRQRTQPRPLGHEECLRFRARLPSLRAEDMQDCLPQILDDLLDTHTNEPGNTENSDFVVQWLNVPSEGADLVFVRQKWGEEGVARTLEEQNHLRLAKLAALAGVTEDQAYAIYKWLQYARTWRDLEWNLEDVDRATAYWFKRAGSRE